jgi:hypothetical protein
MAYEIGQFNSDGTRKVVELVDGDANKPRFIATSGWERELFQLRKNPSYVLSDQDGGVWQTTRTIVNVPLGTTQLSYPDDVLPADRTVFQEAMFDTRTVSAMPATLTLRPSTDDTFTSTQGRRYKPGRIQQLSIGLGQQVFGLNGQPVAGSPWWELAWSVASQLKSRWSVMLRLGQSIDYQAPLVHAIDNPRYGEGFNPVLHDKPINNANIINPMPDLYIGTAAQYVRAVRVHQMASGLWLFRIAFYLGPADPQYQFTIRPMVLDEAETPTSTVDANGFYLWNTSPALVGGRIITRIVWDVTDPLNFADQSVVDALIRSDQRPVTSGAVEEATRVLTTELLAAKGTADSAANRVANLFAKKGTQIAVGESTFFAGKWWTNNTTALITLGTLADPDEASLTAAGLTASAGGGGGASADILISTTDLTGVAVAAGKTLGVWQRTGEPDVLFKPDKNEKWADVDAAVRAVEAEIDAIQATLPWNYTTRQKIPPVPVHSNHGQTAAATNGSILVDQGRVWTKPDANAFDLPAISFTASPIKKGTTYVMATAVETAKRASASQTLIGQQGNVFGTDLPDATDGNKTILYKEFNVPTNNINNFFVPTLGAADGEMQGPVFYEKGKENWTWGPYDFFGKFENEDKTFQTKPFSELVSASTAVTTAQADIAKNKTEIADLKARLSSTSPISLSGAITKVGGSPTIVAADRNGATFSNLSFIFRDNRTIAPGDAKLTFPNRFAEISIPVAAFNDGVLANWTYNAPGAWTGSAAAQPQVSAGDPHRATFWRSYTFDGVIYRIYVQWERVDGEWRFWFQGWHSASWSLTSLADIRADYVLDEDATDPAFAAFAKNKEVAAAYATKAELSVIQLFGTGDALPADDATYKGFILKNHATLPDGIYYYNGVWVQS